MPGGTLEVLLVGAKDLQDQDIFTKMDPYVILTCRTQEQRSTVRSGAGSEPEWNETFLFTISHGTSELNLKIMDKDKFTPDDFVGEANICLEPVFMEGNILPTPYRVVKDVEYCGQITIGLTFFPEGGDENYGGASGQEESYGGWGESY